MQLSTDDKLIVAYMVENLPARYNALIAVLLKMHTFQDMTLSSSQYFSTFRPIIVLPSTWPDILLGQFNSEDKRSMFHIRTF